MKLVFATRNQHKINEIRKMLPAGFDLVGLDEIGCFEDIPETSATIEGNAVQKAVFIWNKFGFHCFADDTGLEVKSLDGAPGVHSARYAGNSCNSDANIDKLLSELLNSNDRSARFKTVICLILDGKQHSFTGIVDGSILNMRKGGSGFGYDPIFQPLGQSTSFAEMTAGQKNSISHRAIAFHKMITFLNSQ